MTQKAIAIECAEWIKRKGVFKADAYVLELLTSMVADITPEHDSKLQELLHLIENKIEKHCLQK